MRFDRERFESAGFTMVPALLSAVEVQLLISAIEERTGTERGRGGVRDVLDHMPELRAVALHPKVRAIVESVLGCDAFLVRSILFDKTEASNWKVPWHQDITIAVYERRDSEGYGPWSTKAGVLHVQPPTDVLERMVTIRIHLDACPAANGALRVMEGSHRLGRINQNYAERHVDESSAITCEAQVGEALVMRPLLLHASSPSAHPGHRRVLHFDFAIGELANGLTWHMRAHA